MLIRHRCHNISYLNANVDDALIIIFFWSAKMNQPLLFCSIAKNRHWPGPRGSRRPTAHHSPAGACAIQTVSVQMDIVSWNPGDKLTKWAEVIQTEVEACVQSQKEERMPAKHSLWLQCRQRRRMKWGLKNWQKVKTTHLVCHFRKARLYYEDHEKSLKDF